MPGILSVFFAFAILGVVILSFNSIGEFIGRLWPWETGQHVVDIVGGVLYTIVILGLAVVLYRYILIILLGPFLSPISEKIEAHLTGKTYNITGFKSNMNMMWRGVRISLRLVAAELFFTLLCYLLLLIPPVAFLVPILVFLVQSYYAGLGNMDFTFERRYTVRESVKKGKQFRWLALGNGIVYIAMMISIVGLFFAPILSVVASTTELVKRLEAEEGNDLSPASGT